MTDVQVKYEKLDHFSQKEVDKLIDSLLNKKVKKPFDMAEYKERIKSISVWTEEDLKIYDEDAIYKRRYD